MLTVEENERLTRVGPETPVGEMMRRYWHPIAASSQLAERGTRPIRVLGEDLVLFRDRSGTLGLVGDRCPHRRAGMIYGIPEAEGLRCAYHGWLWAADGRCLEQPYEGTEDPTSTLRQAQGRLFKERVRITSYPVQELGGMIFAYLGPEPAPLLPRWDLFVLDDVPREIGWCIIPCNWLQITENSLDPVHVEWLHGHFSNYVYERIGEEPSRQPGKHQKIGFSVFEHGIIKRRILEGETEEDEDWAVGHPLVFPYTLASGSAQHRVFQIRVPRDDTTTFHWWYSCYLRRPGEAIPKPDDIPFYEVPVPHLNEQGEPEWALVDNNSGQDMAMWFTQGDCADRTQEHLGASDKGVAMYRHLLELNIQKVQRGEDPMNVFRDPRQNQRIELQVEEAKLGGALQRWRTPGGRRSGNASKYSPILSALEAGSAKEPAGTAS